MYDPSAQYIPSHGLSLQAFWKYLTTLAKEECREDYNIDPRVVRNTLLLVNVFLKQLHGHLHLGFHASLKGEKTGQIRNSSQNLKVDAITPSKALLNKTYPCHF